MRKTVPWVIQWYKWHSDRGCNAYNRFRAYHNAKYGMFSRLMNPADRTADPFLQNHVT